MHKCEQFLKLSVGLGLGLVFLCICLVFGKVWRRCRWHCWGDL